jgi:hypothetical protein
MSQDNQALLKALKNLGDACANVVSLLEGATEAAAAGTEAAGQDAGAQGSEQAAGSEAGADAGVAGSEGEAGAAS